MSRYIDTGPLIYKLKMAIALGKRVDADVSELEAILNDVETMPALYTNPERRGVWIYWRDQDGTKRCKCSKCITSYGCIDTPYCPNCGARMFQ